MLDNLKALVFWLLAAIFVFQPIIVGIIDMMFVLYSGHPVIWDWPSWEQGPIAFGETIRAFWLVAAICFAWPVGQMR